MSEEMRIGVVGAGSWGTAIAHMLVSKGIPTTLWAYEKELCEQIEKHRENTLYLPGIRLASGIAVSNDIEAVVSGKRIVVMVVPSHHMRDVARQASGAVGKDTILVSASKGIENKTHLTMSGVLAEVFGDAGMERIAVLSGPSFAREVASNLPAVVAIAAKNSDMAVYLQEVFAAPLFRVYTNNDPIGVEIGGAIKNVIAIAAGICDGLGLGLSARAAMITRGLAEMRRLGMALGADPHTFSGLAGVGDLILTCTGNLSRNYTVGKRLGEGEKIDDILSGMRMVAEGVKTAKSVFNLSNKVGAEMPICHEVYRILYEGMEPKKAVFRLMTRALKQEIDEEVLNPNPDVS